MMRKDFFFGLVSVYDWEYLWGRTAAQIELRIIDQPILVYKSDKNKEKPWKDGTVSADYANKQYLKWLEGKKKREREGKSVNIAKTFSQNKTMNMQEFLRGEENRES